VVTTPVLFDSNILIEYMNTIPAAQIECDRHSDRAISIITWMEVTAGSLGQAEAVTRAFLGKFLTVQLTPEIAERAVRIRQSMRIKLPDAIILATAQASGRTLLTRNTRNFPEGTPGVLIPY
jgi:predicted nucleic acid-binding protein